METISMDLHKFQMDKKDTIIAELFQELKVRKSELEEKKREGEKKDQEIKLVKSQVQALYNNGAGNTKNQKTEYHNTENNYYFNVKNLDGSINKEEMERLDQIIKDKKKEVAQLENQLYNSSNQIAENKFIPRPNQNNTPTSQNLVCIDSKINQLEEMCKTLYRKLGEENAKGIEIPENLKYIFKRKEIQINVGNTRCIVQIGI